MAAEQACLTSTDPSLWLYATTETPAFRQMERPVTNHTPYPHRKVGTASATRAEPDALGR